MKATKMTEGTMFLYLPDYATETEVYVKTNNDILQGHYVAIFIKNSAIAKFVTFGEDIKFSDQWGISDRYFEQMVEDGRAVIVEDMNEAERICKDKGYTLPDILADKNWD